MRVSLSIKQQKNMASAESQRQWRDRARAGLLRSCTSCGKTLRAESTRDVCKACWLKTPEGRDYNRLKQQAHREKTQSPVDSGL